MKLTKIKNKTKLTPEMLSEQFDAVEGMKIYAQYIASNGNLRESNSADEVARINALHSEDPAISKKYFGLSFVFVNDEAHPYERFYGTVVSKKPMPNGEYRYDVEFANGDVVTYPNETSSTMMYKTLFHNTKEEHDHIRFSLKVSDATDFGTIRK